MAVGREAWRDWHRLFGLLLTDFFTGSPFVVEVERDLSVQQQLLDVVIVRRGRGRFAGGCPVALEGWRPHTLPPGGRAASPTSRRDRATGCRSSGRWSRSRTRPTTS